MLNHCPVDLQWFNWFMVVVLSTSSLNSSNPNVYSLLTLASRPRFKIKVNNQLFKGLWQKLKIERRLLDDEL
jgi:hypothetical protein